uniref:hypothetical protein n=1 Tax=uncultured Dysgonomonas sp. TaxID=206096 RepID=UPI002636A899|nr:hypothetical protein [uncultured Dysgonomonas sp.]
MTADINMTLSGFEKRFKKVFGTSACKWVNQHKAKKSAMRSVTINPHLRSLAIFLVSHRNQLFP